MIRPIVLVFALAACTPTTQEELTRGAARAVIKPVLAQRFPGVPTDAAVDCIVDGARGNELLVLAADAVTGPTASTVEIVGDIARRPAVSACLVRAYAGDILSGL